MLEPQIRMLTWWLDWSQRTARRLERARHDERGEVTATTAMIVLLVIAAIAAGGVIAAKITANANNIPSP